MNDNMDVKDNEPTIGQIGSWIRGRRAERQMNSEDLSDRIGRSRTWVSGLENARGVDPTYTTLVRIAHTFDYTLCQMLKEASDQPIHQEVEG